MGTQGSMTIERAALERRFSLLNGARREDDTWEYDLADLAPASVTALVEHPDVADTHYIEREIGGVSADAPAGTDPAARTAARRARPFAGVRLVSPVLGVLDRRVGRVAGVQRGRARLNHPLDRRHCRRSPARLPAVARLLRPAPSRRRIRLLRRCAVRQAWMAEPQSHQDAEWAAVADGAGAPRRATGFPASSTSRSTAARRGRASTWRASGRRTRARHFSNDYMPALEELLERKWERLVDLDLACAALMARWLGLRHAHRAIVCTRDRRRAHRSARQHLPPLRRLALSLGRLGAGVPRRGRVRGARHHGRMAALRASDLPAAARTLRSLHVRARSGAQLRRRRSVDCVRRHTLEWTIL